MHKNHYDGISFLIANIQIQTLVLHILDINLFQVLSHVNSLLCPT